MAAHAHSTPRDHGFTLVEVVVTILLVTVGLIAVFGALISSNQLNSGAQVREAATGFAEQQLDNLRQEAAAVGYANFGMSAAPSADPGNPDDPDYYVTSVNGTPCLAVQDDFQAGGTPRWCEPFQTTCSGGAACVPSTTQTISGYQGLTGTYDVYVTQHQEMPSTAQGNGCVSGLSVCLSGASSGTADELRITIAVLPASNAGTGARKPIWVSAIITNPQPAQQ